MKFLRSASFFEWFMLAALVVSILIIAGRADRAGAQSQRCTPGDFVNELVEIEALAIGGKKETLSDAGEVARYLAVLNELPPESGDADSILILAHPDMDRVGVWLIHNGINCETFSVDKELHARAWRAARGERA